MKLGLSSYTYAWWTGVPGYPQAQSPLTPELLLELAHRRDLGLVQIGDNMPLHELSKTRLQKLAGLAAELGVEIEVGTRGICPGHLREYLGIAHLLKARFLRTLLDSADHKPSEEEAIRILGPAARAFEDAGVAVGIENHDRLRARQLRHIVEEVGSPSVGICLDTANSLGCGENVSEVLSALRPYVLNLHVKDFVVRRLPHNKGFIIEGAPAGQGFLDIGALLADILVLPRAVNVILEQWPPPAESVHESIRREQAWADEGIVYLKSKIDALAL